MITTRYSELPIEEQLRLAREDIKRDAEATAKACLKKLREGDKYGIFLLMDYSLRDFDEAVKRYNLSLEELGTNAEEMATIRAEVAQIIANSRWDRWNEMATIRTR